MEDLTKPDMEVIRTRVARETMDRVRALVASITSPAVTLSEMTAVLIEKGLRTYLLEAEEEKIVRSTLKALRDKADPAYGEIKRILGTGQQD